MGEEKRVRRVDQSDGLRNIRKLPTTDAWGFLHVDAVVCSPGVYPYLQRDGSTRRELKLPEEIFSERHMQSVRDAVVTDEHLPGKAAVTPHNAREFGRGHSMGAEKADGNLIAPLKITDAELIQSIERREKRGVSLGLDCWFDAKPGIWKGEDGNGPEQPYHGIQRGMVTNQISITRNARIEAAELCLDSDDAVMVVDPPAPKKRENTMSTMRIKVGDSDFEVDSGAGSVIQARLTVLDSLLTESKAEIAAQQANLDTLQAQLDTALEAAKEQKSLTVDSATIPVLFKARRTLLEGAAVLLDPKQLAAVDEASDLDVKRAACEAHKIDLDGKSDDYITARFEALVETKRDSATDTLAASVAGVTAVHPENVNKEEVSDIQKRIDKALKVTDSRHTQNFGGIARGA